MADHRRRVPTVDLAEFLPKFHDVFELLLTPGLSSEYVQLTYCLLYDLAKARGKEKEDNEWIRTATARARGNSIYNDNNVRCVAFFTSRRGDEDERVQPLVPEYLTWIRSELIRCENCKQGHSKHVGDRCLYSPTRLKRPEN